MPAVQQRGLCAFDGQRELLHQRVVVPRPPPKDPRQVVSGPQRQDAHRGLLVHLQAPRGRGGSGQSVCWLWVLSWRAARVWEIWSATV